MQNNQKFTVELSAINPVCGEYNYATLELPATPMEIEDAFQKARITAGREYYVSILSCPKLPDLENTRIDGPINIKELNLFAKRLELLNIDELTAFGGIHRSLISNEEIGLSMEQLINMTFGLDKINVVHGITTDKEVGEFVLDNNINGILAKIPDDVSQYIDLEDLGADFRGKENGQFYNECYVTVGDYGFPTEYVTPCEGRLKFENTIAFALKIAEAPVNDSEETAESAEWIYLPIDRNEADRIASIHNEGRIEDCVYFDFKSAFNEITTEVFGDMEDFDKLNKLAEIYIRSDFEGRAKLKAIMESWEPETIDKALELAQTVDEFKLSYYDVSEDTYAKSYLQKNLPANFDMGMFDGINLHDFGDRVLEDLAAQVTYYGIISCRGGEIFQTITYEGENQEEFEEQDEGIGGMMM